MCYAEDKIAEARERGDEAAVMYWSAIKANVDAAPPITGDLRDRLRVLLRPAPIPVQRAA